MKVLVTGGAGYIGSHTCKLLAISGHEPIVYDNLSTGHKEFVKWGPFEYGDILDTQNLRRCLKQYQPDGIIHFAAFASVGESVINPGKYFRNNLVGTLSILDAMRDENIANIIVSGTCAVYGQPEIIPISESNPTKPINPYGTSKLFMEQMLSDYANAYQTNWVSLRYFNAAGCDLEQEIGEWHEPETHLIPCAISAILNSLKEELTVFGDDYDTPDGTCIRDYIHVNDLAKAHILALEYLINNKKSLPINLGTGSGFSVKEIIHGLEKVSHKTVPYSISGRRPGDPPLLIANTDRAKELLNWKLEYSDINTILQSAWNWAEKMMQNTISKHP